MKLAVFLLKFKKSARKLRVNIVDQSNTKFASICVIDKNLIFASDCTNKRIAMLTVKDDGYGFVALSQLVTPYLQNTEKVKCTTYRILTCTFTLIPL